MRGLRHGRLNFAQALAALALAAIALRALTPPGYMLAPAHDGSNLVTVTLCSGHGPVEALIDLRTGLIRGEADDTPVPEVPAKQTGADAPCVFAAIAPLAPPERAPIIAERAFAPIATPRRAIDIRPGRGLAAPPPWATGPPLFG